jgi:glycolate dehydrogenase iron-sulfur subunit
VTAERGGFAALDSCVHCGFCLQACPTFLVTGDEADGPRGRIELMRGLERGTLTADDPTVTTHLDRCLGCRGCEPVCPSGVGYGQGLEAARERLAAARGVPPLARAALALLTTAGPARVVYALARALRATGIPDRLAGWGRIRFAMGMLAATKPDGRRRYETIRDGRGATTPTVPSRPLPSPTVQLFRGCVMDGLFSHVHDATIRTLAVNGYVTAAVPEQVCCGALHAHAGLADDAHALARANIAAFSDSDAPIVVNSAGCGAQLKAYGDRAFAARVRDVTELLAAAGPLPGAAIAGRVAYDPPCHLLHAQRIADPPLRVLAAVPELEVLTLPDAAQCCGGAGMYTLVEPDLSRAVLAPKLEALRAAAPDAVATGNPGCVMQIGAGLRAAGLALPVVHPVELLDASYRRAGLYG